jgi:3-oxoacyl-[acyl-carrier protein] reductase
METDTRRVLVTGASQGIGLALVRHFLAQGHQVVGVARGEATLAAERYLHVQGDVSSEPDVAALFAEVRARLGGLDALVNNAGLASMNQVALMPYDAARRIVEVNLLGVFLCTRAGIRVLRHSPAGRIVNLTTVAVPLRLEGEAMYAASKCAVEEFTRVVAREVGGLGITCNAVGPGPVRTRLTAKVPERLLDALVKRQAIPRWSTEADVINVVDFFLSPASGMITGQVVYLGGIG